MAFLWIRHDTRLFAIVFVLFNVLLAIFNILNYRVTSRATVPCVVIVAPTSPSVVQEHIVARDRYPQTTTNHYPTTNLHRPQREDLLQKSTGNAPFSWADISTSTPSTRRIVPDKSAISTVPPINGTTTWDVEQRDKYMVVKNYIPADGDPPGFNASVTLSTQGTFEFLDHVEILCKRWDGPISVSVYAPGTDLPIALRKILFLRECGLPCVRTNISWHMIYDSVMGPPAAELGAPDDTAEFDGPINCTAGLSALDLVSDIRKRKKMPYPINVARNVARQQAQTRFVLASDIELYPSVNIVSRFLKMVAKESEAKAKSRHVYTLPIFEIKKEFAPPETKSELARRVKEGNAIFFHKWICDSCQNFPKRYEWVKCMPSNDSLSVFHVTKRQAPRVAWEPIYIGTNSEPYYDERLTWDGKRDKMSQMYELCLMDYDFFILDNAFLVHAPGIKFMSRQDQQRRAPFMVRNNAVHNKLIGQLKRKYGVKKEC